MVMTDSSKTWIYVVKGERHGPVSGSEMAALISNDRLPPGAQIWRDGAKLRRGCQRCAGRDLKPRIKKLSEEDRKRMYDDAIESLRNPTRMCVHCHEMLSGGRCPKHGTIC